MGFAARALKTLGLTSLRIVGAALQHTVQARKTGYGAHDLLDQVSNYQSLEDALADLDLSIGTTSKKRIKRYDGHQPQQICEILANKKEMLANVGLVFGSEENGLSTQQLDLCHLVSTIPLATEYPSLNLAQSVLIYAWELNRLNIDKASVNAAPELQRLLLNEATALLDQLGMADKPLFSQRIMDRLALLSSDDSQLVMSILSKLKR